MKKADIGVNDVSDVVEIMKLNLKSQTTQFKHFLIYQIGACNRPSKVEVDNRAEPLKGISKYHSIWITEDGELRGSVLSCEDCTVKVIIWLPLFSILPISFCVLHGAS